MKYLTIALILISATANAKPHASKAKPAKIYTKTALMNAKDRGFLGIEDYCTEALTGTFIVDGKKVICVVEL